MRFKNLLLELYPIFYEEVTKFPPYKEMMDDVIKALEIKEGGRVLDIGCGTGYLLSKVVDLYQTVEAYGIDTSTTALKLARKRVGKSNRVKLQKYYFENVLPFNDGYSDRVSAVDFILYIPPQTVFEFLKETKRVLKKGGKVCLVYPSEEWLSVIDEYKRFVGDKPLQALSLLPSYFIVGLMHLPLHPKIDSLLKKLKRESIYYFYEKDYVESLLKDLEFQKIKSKITYGKGEVLTSAEK